MEIGTWIASWGEGPLEAGEPRRVVVLLHGFGSSEADLAGLGRHLPEDVDWVALRAPLDSVYGGYAWFPIAEPGTPDPAPVRASVVATLAWISEYLPADSVVIPVGFSQGGLMASQLLRTEPARFVGAAILAGFVLQGEQPLDSVLAENRPPVFYGRGEADDVIAPHAIERTLDWLPAHSTATIASYPGLGHSLSFEEIRDLREFLAATFG